MGSFEQAKRLLVLSGLVLSACRKETPPVPPPGIRPSVSLEPSRVRAGGVLSLEYRWSLVKGWVPSLEGYSAFVHFVDRTGALLFTDDHVPSPPPWEWKPGETYAYRRVVLVPELLPACSGEVRVGLFSGHGRLGLSGVPRGRGEYLGGTLEFLKRKEEGAIVFGDGFYPAFAVPGDPFVARRWMGPKARATFRNRGQDIVVLLSAQTNHVYPKSPRLRLEVGGQGAAVDLPSPDLFSLAVSFRGGDLGGERSRDLILTSSDSFVPELLGGVSDPRVLSLWVHGLVVEEAGDLPASVLSMAKEALPLGSEVEVAPLPRPSAGGAGRAE